MSASILLWLAACTAPGSWLDSEPVEFELPEVDHPRQAQPQGVLEDWVDQGFVGAVGVVDGP